jgi:hypothetical protein
LLVVLWAFFLGAVGEERQKMEGWSFHSGVAVIAARHSGKKQIAE